MAIQTAGEQKYYDLIEEKVKSLRTAMIVGISFLALALISIFSNIVLGILLGVIGAFLTFNNMKKQKEMEGQLESLGDKEQFFHQLIAADTREIQEFHLLVTKDYIVQCSREELYIRSRDQIKSADILSEKGRQVLVLTDNRGKRHELARSKNKKDTAFDEACIALNLKVKNPVHK